MFLWLALTGLLLGALAWSRIVLAALSVAGMSSKKIKAGLTDDAERKATKIILVVTALWVAAFAVGGFIFWQRAPVWSKWFCSAMTLAPPIALVWFVIWRRRRKTRRTQGVSLCRNPPRTTTRVMVAIIGVVVGWSLYSYGTFHTLLPTSRDFANVANCGTYPHTDTNSAPPITLGQEDATLCQVAPGKWRKSPYGNDPFFLGIGIAFVTTMLALTPFLRWAIGSAWRFGVLSGVLWGIPMVLLGLQLNFVEGTLSLGWALHVVFYAEGIAVIGGLLVYPMLGRWLLERKRGA